MKYEQPYTIRNQLNNLEKQLDFRLEEQIKEQLIYYEHNKIKHLRRHERKYNEEKI